MPTVNGVSNDVFANTLRALARTSATAAKGAAERADRLPDGSRRLGQEISVDGNVSAGEMSEFVRVTSGVAQGLSAGEKRLGNAARILHQAMFEVPSTPIALTPNVLEASWRREVPVAGLTGNVEVRNEIDHRLVLSTDRRQFAQRIAGPGQRTISPDDFNKALPMLSLDERYLANQLLNDLFFSGPLATSSNSATTPGGRAVTVETTQTGSAELPRGGLRYTPGPAKYAISLQHTVDVSLTRRQVLVDARTGEAFTPDANGHVRLPLAGSRDLAVVTRGATGKVLERFTVSVGASGFSGAV